MSDSKTVSEAVRALYMLGRLNEHEHTQRFLLSYADRTTDADRAKVVEDIMSALEWDANVRGVVE